MDKKQDLKPLIWIATFVLFLFSLLILQFYKIQMIEVVKWRKAASKQHQLVVVEPYRRGVFYSNPSLKPGHPQEPQPLVVDVPRFHLYADPAVIGAQHRKAIVENLQKITPLDPKHLLLQLEKKSRSRKMILWLLPQTRDAILKWWAPYARSHKLPRNALFFVQDYQRSYPFGKLLGQILHTVRAEREPKMRQCVPTGGLEFILDRYLRGEDGQRMILRSPRQPLDMGQLIKPPKHGSDVYLTIDCYLQAVAEEEIKKAVIAAEAKGGWALVMDPYTGEMLAWAQYPFFEPGKYRDYFNDPLKQEDALVKGATIAYEPGSTIKVMTHVIALKANEEMARRGRPPLFSLQEKIATSPRLFPGRKKPLKELSIHHKHLNFEMAIQKSSNVYPATLVHRIVEALGAEWYRNALEETFGLGRKTGISLPAESAGVLPQVKDWSKPTPYSIAMGHNLMATAIQMAAGYAIFANGGYKVKPALVKKIADPAGAVIFEHKSQLSKRVVEKGMLDCVIKPMRYVPKPGGTARRANIPGYTSAAKTGSTEKVVNGVYSKEVHISSCMGFAPADHPRIVIAVVIDEPAYKYIPGIGKNQMGGICAAPCFQQIGLKTLQYLGVPPDDPNNTAWSQEIKALKEQYDLWNTP